MVDYLSRSGEFVKSASSTIEKLIADRTRQYFYGGSKQQPTSATVSVNESLHRTDYVLRHLREVSSAVRGTLDGNEWLPRSYSRKDWESFGESISALAFHLADGTRRLRLVETPAEGVRSERSFPGQEELVNELLRLGRLARIG